MRRASKGALAGGESVQNSAYWCRVSMPLMALGQRRQRATGRGPRAGRKMRRSLSGHLGYVVG